MPACMIWLMNTCWKPVWRCICNVKQWEYIHCYMYTWPFDLTFTKCTFLDIQISFVQLVLVIWTWSRRPKSKIHPFPTVKFPKGKSKSKFLRLCWVTFNHMQKCTNGFVSLTHSYQPCSLGSLLPRREILLFEDIISNYKGIEYSFSFH